MRVTPGWSAGKAVPYRSLYLAFCARAGRARPPAKNASVPAPTRPAPNVRREMMLRDIDVSSWVAMRRVDTAAIADRCLARESRRQALIGSTACVDV